MEIFLVNPKVWMDYEAEHLVNLNAAERSYAVALLTELHNRHIGIPLRMVSGLVPILTSPTMRIADAISPWMEVLDRLTSEIRSEQRLVAKGGRRSSFQFGLSITAAPIYMIRRLVVPLVETACLELKKCFLLCEDVSTSQGITLLELKKYDDQVSNLIMKYANDAVKDPRFDLFWKERAATLLTYSSLSKLEKTLPDPEPLSISLTFRLVALPKLARKYEHLNRIHLRYSKNRSRQLREEGLAGIVQTRSLEMLQRILISEMINPTPILADRILNSGYLVTERLPRRERLRDALIITFLPPELQKLPAADFLRVCWLNTMSLVYQALLHNSLHDSLIFWVEGNAMDQFEVTTISVSEMHLSLMENSNYEVSHSRVFRQGFIHHAQLLPKLIDRRRKPSYLSIGGNDLPSNSARWMDKVWSTPFTEKFKIPAAKNTDKMPKIIELPMQFKSLVEKFAYVHVMSLLSLDEIDPQERDAPRESSIARQLAQNIYSEDHKGFFHSETWVQPKNFTEMKNGELLCNITNAYQSQPVYWNGQQEVDNLVSGAQDLEKVWFEEIIQEMQRE